MHVILICLHKSLYKNKINDFYSMLVTYLQLNNMFMRNSFLQILLFYLTILKYTSGNQHIVCETCADYTMKTKNCENNYDVLSDVVI